MMNQTRHKVDSNQDNTCRFEKQGLVRIQGSRLLTKTLNELGSPHYT